jgi:hypothetical protein
MGTEVKSSVGSYDQTHANYAQLVHARRSAVAWPPGASRFAPLDPVREARARKDIAFTPAGSPPPSIALHPRIGATRRWVAHHCADPGGALRPAVGRVAAYGHRPVVRSAREAGARTDNALFRPAAHRHLPLRCARPGAFADERRIARRSRAPESQVESANPFRQSASGSP